MDGMAPLWDAGLHELTAINSTSLTYDLKGNLTTNSNGQTYTWDYENCMKTAVIGTDTATYSYDATPTTAGAQ